MKLSFVTVKLLTIGMLIVETNDMYLYWNPVYQEAKESLDSLFLQLLRTRYLMLTVSSRSQWSHQEFVGRCKTVTAEHPIL